MARRPSYGVPQSTSVALPKTSLHALILLLLAAHGTIYRPCLAYQILGGPPPPPNEPAPSAPPHAVTLRHLNGGLGRTLEFAQRREEDDGSVSMSGTAWEASSVLADFVTNPRSGIEWKDKLVLELGAGIGICSVAAGLMGANVIATDASTTSLGLLRENAARYAKECTEAGGSVAVMPLLWGDLDMIAELGLPHPPDLVLASDVVYHGSAMESLQKTIAALCPPSDAKTTAAKTTRVIWAHTWRADPDQDEAYFRSYEDIYGFRRTDVDPNLLPEEYRKRGYDGRLPVSIFSMTR